MAYNIWLSIENRWTINKHPELGYQNGIIPFKLTYNEAMEWFKDSQFKATHHKYEVRVIPGTENDCIHDCCKK